MASLSFLVTIAASCNRHSNTEKVVKRDLHAVSTGPENYFLQPYFIDLADSFLLVADKGQESYFHFIDTSGTVMPVIYGEKGIAPESITFKPVLSHPSVYNGSLAYYDFGRVSFRFISLERILSGGNPLPDLYYFLSPDLINAQNLLVVNDSMLVVAGGLVRGKLAFYNLLTGDSRFTGFHPEIRKLDIPDDNAIIYHSSLSASPGHSLVVSAMIYLKVIDLYSPSGKLIRRIQDERSFDNAFNVNNQITCDETRIHYLDVFATDSMIYALHAGIPGGKLNDPKNANSTSVTIEVYDHMGDLRSLFTVDRLITCLVADEKRKTLYGLDPWNEMQPLVKILME